MIPAPEEGPVRVLVVDDEPDIEALIRQRFKRRPGDFEFIFARNGKEALDRLAADPSLDLIVTDINMPVMDGLALLRNLRGMNGRLTKAVVLSAYGDMQNIRAAMNRGAFDFLTKPIDFADFETTVRRTREALLAELESAQDRAQLAALQQELNIAARIQASILPREFFPGRKDFGLFAQMTPARLVGGDFYDFFLIDERRLGFLIGDVSGKGIPAALFMAVSRTLLRATAQQGISPSECLDYANRMLHRQGDEGVFVTVFYGILRTDSGEVEYAIGGHNPPYAISSAGELRIISEPGGMVVGLLPEARYETGRIQLRSGESMLLFTDGITEAINPEERFFGERRLRAILASHAQASPQEMVQAVFSGVEQFMAGRPLADDMTVLAVHWTGRQEQ